jgi:transcriptional regulator with XRE-family HTH domain
VHIARKFELLLEAYRRPDGRLWTGQEIDEATGGVVTRSYITNLRKGRIQNPGYEKLRAIARALGFPPQLWFEERLTPEGVASMESGRELRGIDKKVSHLFGIMGKDDDGKPLTDAEVARLSFGNLTEEDVEAIRTGKQSNPPVSQIVALADVFAVHPSYFLDGTKHPALFHSEAMEIFQDETVRAIAHKSLHLPGRERQMVLNIIQQLEQMREADRGNTS